MPRRQAFGFFLPAGPRPGLAGGHVYPSPNLTASLSEIVAALAAAIDLVSRTPPTIRVRGFGFFLPGHPRPGLAGGTAGAHLGAPIGGETLAIADSLARVFGLPRSASLGLLDTWVMSLPAALYWGLVTDQRVALDSALALLIAVQRIGTLTLVDAVALLTTRLVSAGLALVDTEAVQVILGAVGSGTLTLVDAVAIVTALAPSAMLTLRDTVLLVGGAPVDQLRWAPRWLVEIEVP